MRLTKIKIIKDMVSINWETPVKGGRMIKNTIESPDDPKPDFAKAIKALKPHLIQMCEVESLPSKLITVTGASLSYKGDNDIMNVVITGNKTHVNSGGCLNLNSPNKPAVSTTGDPTDAANLLDEKCVEKIETLIDEAKAYIKGERLQMELLNKKKGAKK